MAISSVSFGMIEISTNTLAEWVERQLLFDTGSFPEIKYLDLLNQKRPMIHGNAN